MASDKVYVVVSDSDETPVREGYYTRAAAESRRDELTIGHDDARFAVAVMPAAEWDEFERCGNRSAAFTRAELAALGVI